jgi:hypothetical protein
MSRFVGRALKRAIIEWAHSSPPRQRRRTLGYRRALTLAQSDVDPGFARGESAMRNEPFVFKASATLARYSGYFADSARTLQTAIEGVPASSIYYHLHHALFRMHFTTSEFLDDFASWAWIMPRGAPREINALQRAAAIVVQKSLKEGFGLTVTEAMWKAKPVIGGAVGGIRRQIIQGRTGYLVHSVEGMAYRVRQLLGKPGLARQLGENAKRFVTESYMPTVYLRQWLLTLLAIESGCAGSGARVDQRSSRYPRYIAQGFVRARPCTPTAHRWAGRCRRR